MPCEHLSFRKPSCTATLFLMFLKIPRHRNDYCLLNYSKLKSLKGSDASEYISFTLTLTSDRCFGNEENRNPYTMNAHKSRKLLFKRKGATPLYSIFRAHKRGSALRGGNRQIFPATQRPCRSIEISSEFSLYILTKHHRPTSHNFLYFL